MGRDVRYGSWYFDERAGSFGSVTFTKMRELEARL